MRRPSMNARPKPYQIKAQQIPHGFIEEGGHVPSAVHVHRQRKPLQRGVFDQPSVGLAVKVIAPAADGLTENQGGGDHVGQLAKGHFLDSGKREYRQRAADDPAVNSQAAFPDVQDGQRILPVHIPLKGHVIQPGSDHARGDHPQRQVVGQVLGQAQPLFLPGTQEHADRHGAGNQQPVNGNDAK